jgi:hypothetical protein
MNEVLGTCAVRMKRSTRASHNRRSGLVVLLCLHLLVTPFTSLAASVLLAGKTNAPAVNRAPTESGGGWKEIASAPLTSASPSFQIAGRTLRLPDDLPAILVHYQQRAPHDYTARWMKKNIFLPRNSLAGQALIEKRQVQYGSYAAVPFTVPALTWSEDPFTNLNWQWYHHQLMSVHFLLAAAQTNQPNALDTARQIVRSWAAANCTAKCPSPQSWNDHSTAYRLRTLMCLFEQLRVEPAADMEFLGLLLRMIDSHCRVLADEKFFMRHHNHGFDQATILFWAARAFPELAGATEWRSLSKARLREEIAFMFTPEGIHVENSPSYHVWLLASLEESISLLEEEPRADLESLLSAGWEYAAFVLQPNGRLPLVGDTESRDFSTVRSTRSSAGAQNFLYSATRGKAGTKPLRADRVFARSGYAVLRDEWHDAPHFTNTVHLFFKCGFLSSVHRHDDDLNVVLFAFGEEWLIDSGLYGYEEEGPIRRYMRSTDAHNTVVVHGSAVVRDVTKLPGPGSGIIEHGIEKTKSFVTGRSTMYAGQVVERRVEYVKPDRIVIHDSVSPATGNVSPKPDFTVLFHLPRDKQISIKPDSQVVAVSPSGHCLLLEAQPVPRRVSLLTGKGDGKGGSVSWASEGITKIVPSHCVRFEYTDTENATCTLTLLPREGEGKKAQTP